MLKIYPGIFHEEQGTFWMEFPDLEGCQTCGTTLEETMELAQEALVLYLVSKKEAIGLYLEDCEDYPSPSIPTDIDLKATEFVAMVEFDAPAYKKQHDTKAVITGKHRLAFRHFSKLSIKSLDGIRRIDQCPHLGRVFEIGGQLRPMISPRF